MAALRRWATASLAIEAARDAARHKRQLLERLEEPRTMATVQELAKLAVDPWEVAKAMGLQPSGPGLRGQDNVPGQPETFRGGGG